MTKWQPVKDEKDYNNRVKATLDDILGYIQSYPITKPETIAYILKIRSKHVNVTPLDAIDFMEDTR